MGAHNKIYNLGETDRAALDEQLRNPGKTYPEVRAWLIDRGFRFSLDSLHRYAAERGLRKRRPQAFSKIDRLLSAEDRKQYLKLAVDPRSTVPLLRAWLLEHGASVRPQAIRRHRDRYLAEYGKVERAAQQANIVVQIAREEGIAGLSEVALVHLEQVLMQQFTLAMDEKKRLEAGALSEMSKSLATVMSTRETAEAIRRENEAQKRKAAEEAERLARRGVSGADIAARVKEILGA
jgi:hypothetical protein